MFNFSSKKSVSSHRGDDSIFPNNSSVCFVNFMVRKYFLVVSLFFLLLPCLSQAWGILNSSCLQQLWNTFKSAKSIMSQCFSFLNSLIVSSFPRPFYHLSDHSCCHSLYFFYLSTFLLTWQIWIPKYTPFVKGHIEWFELKGTLKVT